MRITLKINVGEKPIELPIQLTMRACRIYRNQFSRDLISDMEALYKRLNPNPFEGVDLSGIKSDSMANEEEFYKLLMKQVDVTKLMENSEVVLNFDELERGGQIIWAFAKNDRENIPDYEKWIDEFDFVFPVAEIISTLYEAWTKTALPTVELKN